MAAVIVRRDCEFAALNALVMSHGSSKPAALSSLALRALDATMRRVLTIQPPMPSMPPPVTNMPILSDFFNGSLTSSPSKSPFFRAKGAKMITQACPTWIDLHNSTS